MSGAVSRTSLLPCLGRKSMLMRETSMAVEADNKRAVNG